MKRDDIESILANEVRITPSPAFLASVMHAVEREAASLPPLEFPWIRALPLFLAVIAAIIGAIEQGVDLLNDPSAIEALGSQLGQIADIAAGFELQWIALAMAATVISLTLASGLMRSRNWV